MNRLTRRLLIFGGAVVALPVVGLSAATLACKFSVGSRGTSAGASAIVDLIADLFPESTATRRLAATYLLQRNSTVLMALERLEQDDRIRRSAETGCAAPAQFEQACREDFEAGRVHCVDGWILAQTELDAAAVRTMV